MRQEVNWQYKITFYEVLFPSNFWLGKEIITVILLGGGAVAWSLMSRILILGASRQCIFFSPFGYQIMQNFKEVAGKTDKKICF